MSDQKQFSGRTAIVTGATRGIGRAIALELARRGADVAFNYAKSAEAAESLTKELEALGVRSVASQCDVANTEAAAEMVKLTKDTFGRIDFLVNNAGITRDNLILRMKESDWDDVIDTNLKGAWNFAKAALRTMLRQEEVARSLTSRPSAAKSTWPGNRIIQHQKGMVGLTKALAREVASGRLPSTRWRLAWLQLTCRACSMTITESKSLSRFRLVVLPKPTKLRASPAFCSPMTQNTSPAR